MMQALGMSMNPSIYKNLPYDPLKDLQPVALFGTVVPVVLAIGPKIEATTLRDFIALAKANPKRYKGASFATGSGTLMLEMFRLQADVDVPIVPYRGVVDAVAATTAGETDLVIMDGTSVVPHIKAGRLRGMAIAGDARLAEIPDVPTTAEAGLPNYKIEFWYGAFTRGGTPRPLVERLNAEINKAVARPDVQEKLQGDGAEPRQSHGRPIRRPASSRNDGMGGNCETVRVQAAGTLPVNRRLRVVGNVHRGTSMTSTKEATAGEAATRWKNVLVEFQDGIAWVTLNRPEKRNAMSPALNREMLDVLDALEVDDRCKVLVLTGAGESFSAGMDIKEYFREVDKATPIGVMRVQRDSMAWQWRRLMYLPQADHRHGQRLVLRRRVSRRSCRATCRSRRKTRCSACRKSTGASFPPAT